MTNIEFIVSNSWASSDLGLIEDIEESIIHMVSVHPKGINLYVGSESEKVYDLWLEK